MKYNLPNISTNTYTFSSIIIGYLLIDHLTANEQNALGNWFMTIGQILEANSSWQQVLEERIKGNTININSHSYKNNGSAYMNNDPLEDVPNDDLDYIKKAIELIKEELDKISVDK